MEHQVLNTPPGIDRVERGGVNSVIQRHRPEPAAAPPPRAASAFAPWRPVRPSDGPS
ncbi:hypothetical protein [Streptomyces sp. bgisy034]|uniref:hypothetical protein n=1 Tax=Streptomyces sp. bgisy034 TaxID=3413774 RepID=UPI003EBE06E4